MPYTTVDRAVLRARLQDRYTGDPFWSNTEANDALNEALRYFNLFTGYWRGTVNVATVVGTPFVPVPATLTYRTRVLPASGPALTLKSIVGLYRQRQGWRTQTTASGGGVPTSMQDWAPVGLRQIAVWPRPTVITPLTIEGVKITPVMSDDTAPVDVGDEELKLVLDEALWVLVYKRPSLVEQMQPRHVSFLKGCLERNDQLRRSSYFKKYLGLDQAQRLRPTRAPNDALAAPAGGTP